MLLLLLIWLKSYSNFFILLSRLVIESKLMSFRCVASNNLSSSICDLMCLMIISSYNYSLKTIYILMLLIFESFGEDCCVLFQNFYFIGDGCLDWDVDLGLFALKLWNLLRFLSLSARCCPHLTIIGRFPSSTKLS